MIKVYAIKNNDKIEIRGVSDWRRQEAVEAHLRAHTVTATPHERYGTVYVLDEPLPQEEEEEE